MHPSVGSQAISQTPWSPSTWRSRPIRQAPTYADQAALEAVEARLHRYPPLVFASEAERLKARLAAASRGEAFVLQGGACAESFRDFTGDVVQDTFRVLLQMSALLAFATKVPVVKIGRMAGQYAKPRSSPTEKRDGVELPCYRGDVINGYEFTAEAREPDPKRMEIGYFQAAGVLNLLRAMARGEEANLHAIHRWNVDFVERLRKIPRYRELEDQIGDSLTFMQACGVRADSAQLRETEFYTSHEALLLPYEEALTRIDSTTGEYYDHSAHFIWIGDRTRQPEGAHVEFLRGVRNPIGIKVGPTTRIDELLSLLEILNPQDEAGRITLISRMGSKKVRELLPPLLDAVHKSGRCVTWLCDPMHGNTTTASNKLKTRAFDDVFDEIIGFFEVFRKAGLPAGGIHLEMTGRDVTECTGGSQCLTDDNLPERYETFCDPRLNGEQSMEIAFKLADALIKTPLVK
ncbi:3-deoxy-7-phosphoheptulonate synthase class II [Saccharibacter sp. 17.LH.SD]|uniref:class II 3-deoxy-7-phosphoheptulonate synthase n=1 Tax=Saccharibacter sp. 17.LH.SD TaxID=2689393 RepID=UPI00136E85CC|nr:3-deoxy-7-phosphoheptulonate synthase class II [Saccharibacter sp. 17.LH.SD]MXV44053.1 3-deoxy-7-phosphoheptulonate synthase class II [Saccharibacter sp. 17.LH.SD]